MTCPRCGLPDLHRGQGDGYGSCDCPRCDCCHAAPDDCDCRRDFDLYIDEEDEPFDPWCSDTACDHRALRIMRRRSEEEHSDGRA